MQKLTNDEMATVNGGELNECTVLKVTTALSCYTGLAIACLIGAVGDAVLC